MAKNLPVKIFYKRENDELVREASSGNNRPKWILSHQELRRRSEFFTERLYSLNERFIEKRKFDDHVPAVVKFRVHEDALAKTHRKTISKLFSVNRKINIIGLFGENELLVKIDDADDLNEILNRFDRYQFNEIGISALEDANLFKPLKNIDKKGDKNLKIKLFDYQNKELNGLTENRFEEFCQEFELNFKKIHYSDDLHIYSVDRSCLDYIDDLEDFDGIFSITEIPKVEISLDGISEKGEMPIIEPEAGREYPVLGILDSGISKNKYLKPWVLENDYVPFDESDINNSHGTFVTGVAVYGDTLEDRSLTGTDGCKVFNATVFPTGYWDEFNLVEKIKEAIQLNTEIKVWNLSLGTNTEADFDSFSDFGKALDELQEKHNILIVKSAGNCTNFMRGKAISRIAKSADSVRSLVVGSIAHDKNQYDISEINTPSPFSRTGPGPANIVKPELVHYGGNAGTRNGSMVKTGVYSFSSDGTIIRDSGTSFSTPRIASMAANLQLMLNEPFNANLIKALLMHSAKYPAEFNVEMNERLNHAGYGLPLSVEDIIYNDENEITLIMQDTIEKGKFINVMDFPYPASLVEDDYYYGEVTITLVTDPILSKNQGNEYCQTNINVFFGSYDDKVERDVDQPTIRNPIGTDGNRNFLNESLFSKRIMKDPDNQFNSERVLINHHKKYQPVKKWVINLEEMTEGNRERFLKSPKKWYLKLEALFRHNVEVMAERNNRDLSVDFALVITIRDNKRKGNLYNQVNQLLDQYNFLHNNIQINEKIQIQTGG